MSTVSIVITCVTLGLVGYYFFKKRRKHYNLPPGPFPVPVVGNLFSLSSRLHKDFHKWSQAYGPVFTVYLGTIRTVILNDISVIRQAFNDPVFSGRCSEVMGIINPISEGKYGILSVDGTQWAEQRRFTMKHLRDFGFGKKTMESLIIDEVREFLSFLKAQQGVPVKVKERFTLALVNSLWMIMSGTRFGHDDAQLKAILEEANTSFKVFMSKAYLMFFPRLVKIAPKLVGYDKIIDGVQHFSQIFRDIIKSHTGDPAPDNHPRDFTDVYLAEINKTLDPKSTFFGSTGMSNLLAVLADIYGSALMTQTSAMNWTMLYLVRFPSVQAKLHKEIDQVIGQNRLPELSDTKNMPYCEALFLEVLRYSEFNSISLFHSSTEDARLCGYDIPKNTMIIANFYTSNHSEELWKDPFNFRPERFLNPSETGVLKFDHFIPFSVGKRDCLGQTMAKNTFFLFIASIFQRFSVTPDPTKPEPSLQPTEGLFSDAEDYIVIFQERVGN